MPGLYPLWSLVSIIEEWYLQKGIGLRGAHKGGGIGRKSKIKKKIKKLKLWSDELRPYLETAYFSTKSLRNFWY